MILDNCHRASCVQIIKQLRQRVKGLEIMNNKICEAARDEFQKQCHRYEQLAATQAHNLRLRSALQKEANIYMDNDPEDGPPEYITEALREPTDTEALEKYVLERLELVAWREFDGEGNWDYCSYEDNETYRDDWIKRNPKPIYKDWVQPLYSLKEPK